MKLLFLDDSKTKKSNRQSLGPVLGVGGVAIDADNVRSLEDALEELVTSKYEFPAGEVFKWSPSKDHWMRTNLEGKVRAQFFKEVLETCIYHGAAFLAAAVDTTKNHATRNATGHEIDALSLALERFDTFMTDEHGLVFLAKPSGGQKDENKMLAECIDLLQDGTGFVSFKKLALNVVTVPFPHSRTLQCADLVVSATTAMTAGLNGYAAPLFEVVKAGFHRNSKGQIGGAGLKLHPSTLTNLYHWLLEDEYYVRGNSGLPLPHNSYYYSKDPLSR